jgi:hypothetical protein
MYSPDTLLDLLSLPLCLYASMQRDGRLFDRDPYAARQISGCEVGRDFVSNLVISAHDVAGRADSDIHGDATHAINTMGCTDSADFVCMAWTVSIEGYDPPARRYRDARCTHAWVEIEFCRNPVPYDCVVVHRAPPKASQLKD